MESENSVSNPPSSRTFDEWLAGRPNLAAGSRRKYARVARSFERSRDPVSTDGMASFLSKHRQRHVKAGLILYCKFLAKPDIAAEIRSMKVKYRKRPPRAIPVKDELLSVANACDHETRHIALFLMYTGCRCQEAFTVKLSDIAKDGKVTIRDIKTEGKYREVYLPDDYYQELMDYLTNGKGVLGNQRIFYENRKGSGDSLRADFYDKLNEVAIRKIGRPIQTHDFRRFTASYLYKKTRDIEFVRRILGHSGIETTQRYVKYAVGPDDLKRSKQLLSGLRTQ